MPKRTAQQGIIFPKIAPIAGRAYGYRSAYGGLATTTLVLTANTLYAMPFFVPAPLAATQLALNVTSLIALSHCRVGIYGATVDGLPGALLAAGATELDTSGTGIKTAVVALTLLPGRLYYLALASEINPTVTATTPLLAQFGNADAADNNPRSHVNRAFTYAALPDPWGTVAGYGTAAPHLVVAAV